MVPHRPGSESPRGGAGASPASNVVVTMMLDGCWPGMMMENDYARNSSDSRGDYVRLQLYVASRNYIFTAIATNMPVDAATKLAWMP